MISNPYLMIRRRLRLGGRSLGLTSSTVSRIENGQYEELSDGMVEALFIAVAESGVDTDVLAAELERDFGTPYLAEAYLRWRRMKRKIEGDTVAWPKLSVVRARVRDGEAPMGAFARLTSGSVEKFCSQFCIQAPTLGRYIKGRSGAKTLPYLEPPVSLREALTDAGYDKPESLFELQRKWIDGE